MAVLRAPQTPHQLSTCVRVVFEFRLLKFDNKAFQELTESPEPVLTSSVDGFVQLLPIVAQASERIRTVRKKVNPE